MLGARSHAALVWSFVIGVILLGCEPRRRTEVLVVIDAEPSVAMDVTSLRVRVEGGAEVLSERLDQTLGTLSMPVQLPKTVALVPLDRDARRRFRVEATAYAGDGTPIGTVRALSGFLEERTLVLRLELDEACRTTRCPESCRGGTCVPEAVDPDTLPELDDTRDAGVQFPDAAPLPNDAPLPSDAGLDAVAPDVEAPPDAFARDASPLPDATSGDDAFSVGDAGHFGGGDLCGPDCLTLPLPVGIGRGITFNTGEVWTRPEAGVCPMPLTATGTYSWAAQRLYNSSGSAVSVTLDTSRSDPDTMLFVYREIFPMLGSFPRPPADTTDCLVAIDDTPSVSPHVRTSVIVPALEAIIVLVTTAAPDTLGHAQLDMR